MLEQNVAEFRAGAAAQRLQDGFMLTHRLAPAVALAGKIGGIAHPAYPSGEVGVSAKQRRVARRFQDLVVDQLVDAEIAVHVAVQVKTVHLVVQPLDLGDFVVGDVFAGQPSGQPFKASRSGVREIPSISQSWRSGTRAPSAILPSTIWSRSRVRISSCSDWSSRSETASAATALEVASLGIRGFMGGTYAVAGRPS